MNEPQDIQPDRQHIKQFADFLFGQARGLRAIWALPRKGSGLFFGPGEHDRLAQEAVNYDADGNHSVYVRMTTVEPSAAHAAMSSGGRCKDADAQELPALWGDVDIAGPGHRHDESKRGFPLPPDEESARKIVTMSSLPEPTAWAFTGGGLYPFWLLAAPVAVTPAVADLSKRWGVELRRSANALGFDYGEGVHDMSRVLRLPGTVNRKPGTEHRACLVLTADGPRYTLEQLAAALPTSSAPMPAPVPPPVALDTSSPLHDFRARADWSDILLPNGWTFDHADRDGTRYWVRPGGSSTGTHSATTDRPGDGSRLFIFSTETSLPAQQPLNKDFVYAHYAHGGDMSAARAALLAAGYGRAAVQVPAATVIPGGLLPPSPAAPGEPSALRPLDEALIAIKEPDGLIAVARELADADALTYDRYARAIAETAVTGKDGLRRLVAEQKAALKEEKAQAEAQRKREEADQQATAAAQEGRLMPGPWDPMAAARHLAGQNGGRKSADRTHEDGTSLLRFWKGDWYAYDVDQRRWRPEDDRAVRGWIYRRTETAVYRNDDDIKPWLPNTDRVNKVIDALSSAVLYRGGDTTDDSPDFIACRNGIVGLDGSWTEHHPSRFTLTCLPFDFDASARCPQWLRFLDEVLPGDVQAHQLLAEFFGYILSGDTSQQKMLSLVGPRRCGKGTVSRVLEALLGPDLCAAPTISSITGQFGRQALIGKQLATFKDVRWSARNAQDAVEPLLTIIGEDSQDIPRKMRTDWHGTLPTRFMAMSNNAPVFKDASGALAGRMLHIEFTRTFYGREDVTLTRRLLTELPGILNWAIEGLRTLRERGRFVEPESARELAAEVELASSPFTVFAAERLLLGPAYAESFVSTHNLFSAYQNWHMQEFSVAYQGTSRSFADGLRSALRDQGVRPKRFTDRRGLIGLALKDSPLSLGAFPAGVPVASSN